MVVHLFQFARALPFLLTACQFTWANYSAPATVPYIPDYGGVLSGERDPAGEAKFVVGHRYFLNDADWEVSTLAGVYDVTLKQISARLYSVAKVEKYGYTDGATERSRFWNPTGITYSEGNKTIFVADKNNHRIRSINPFTGVTSTLAGSGVAGFLDSSDRMQAQFNYPSGITVDGKGNVYVADMHNHRIRCVTSQGPVVTIAGGVAGYANLPGKAAMFNYPTGLASAEDGTLFVADMNNHRIRKIFLDNLGNPLAMNRLVVTLAGGAAGWKDAFGAYAKFHSPTGIALHLATGDLYVADCSNQRIRRVDKYGTVTTIAGSSVGDADGQNSMKARFNFPFGITVSQVLFASICLHLPPFASTYLRFACRCLYRTLSKGSRIFLPASTSPTRSATESGPCIDTITIQRSSPWQGRYGPTTTALRWRGVYRGTSTGTGISPRPLSQRGL